MFSSVRQSNIEAWAQARAQSTTEQGTTAPYLPRFGDRKANEIARHAAVITPVPRDVAWKLNRRITTRLQDVGVSAAAFHAMPTSSWHVTLG